MQRSQTAKDGYIDSFKLLQQLIAANNCPQNLHFVFSGNDVRQEDGNEPQQKRSKNVTKLTNKDFRTLANIMTSGSLPSQSIICFRVLTFSPRQIKIIARALASGDCPSQLALRFDWCKMGDDHLQVLLDAAITAKELTQISFSLWGNQLTTKGAKAIAKAISLGAFDLRCGLMLANNQIDGEGMLAVMSALFAKHTDAPVHCEFESNAINDASIKDLMKLLLTTPHPRQLSIDLTSNPITQLGLEAIFEAYKLGRFSQELRIATCTHAFGEWHARSNTVLIRNSMRLQTVLNCLAFLQGARQSECMVSWLPPEILLNILAEVYPFQSALKETGKRENQYFANRVFSFFCSLPQSRVSIPPPPVLYLAPNSNT